MKRFIPLFLIFIPCLSFSQHIGETYKDIKKIMKKDYAEDSIVMAEDVIYCYATSNTEEIDIYRFDDEGLCDTVEHHGPMRGLELYKQLYSNTMHKMNDSTWCTEKDRKRKYLKLYTCPETERYKFVIYEQLLGFRRK